MYHEGVGRHVPEALARSEGPRWREAPYFARSQTLSHPEGVQPSAKRLAFYVFDSNSVVAHTALYTPSVAVETQDSTELR
jgi:hypothetical protein